MKQVQSTQRYQKPEIDLGLAVLSVVFNKRPLTSRFIAEVCGCSHTAIENTQRRAMRKVKEQLDMQNLRQIFKLELQHDN